MICCVSQSRGGWAADTGPGGVLRLNAQLKQEALTWRAAGDGDRHALTGAELSVAWRAAHGFDAAEGELMTPADKAALIKSVIEMRRGVLPYPA